MPVAIIGSWPERCVHPAVFLISVILARHMTRAQGERKRENIKVEVHARNAARVSRFDEFLDRSNMH
jgi:hypothetical protein